MTTHAELMLKIIKENPGIASFDIRKLYFPNEGHDRCVIAHTLTKLWRRGLVDRERVIGRSAKTYKYTIAGKDMNKIDQVFIIVERNPGISVRQVQEIAERNGIPPSGIPTYITRLINSGKVVRRKFYPEHDRPHFQLWASEKAIEMPVDPIYLPPDREALTPAQAAEFVGISLQALYDYGSMDWFGFTEGSDGERHYLTEDLERLKTYISDSTEASTLQNAAGVLKPAKAIVEMRASADEKREDPFKLAVKIAAMICLHEASLATDHSAFEALSCAARRIDNLA